MGVRIPERGRHPGSPATTIVAIQDRRRGHTAPFFNQQIRPSKMRPTGPLKSRPGIHRREVDGELLKRKGTWRWVLWMSSYSVLLPLTQGQWRAGTTGKQVRGQVSFRAKRPDPLLPYPVAIRSRATVTIPILCLVRMLAQSVQHGARYLSPRHRAVPW